MERELSFYKRIGGRKGNPDGLDREYLTEWFDTMQHTGVKWFGCDGMSVVGFKPGEGEKLVDFVANECDKRGLKMSSFHFASATFFETEEKLKDIHERFRANVELFSGFKPLSFVMHVGWLTDYECDWKIMYREMCVKYGEDEVIKRICETITYLADLLAEKGINLALETMGNLFPMGKVEEIDRYMELINRPNVGVCIDSGHLMTAGVNPADIIRKTGNKIYETHFHDNMGARYGKDMHLPVGFGATDWLDIQFAMDEIGFEGPVTFETGGWLFTENEEESLIKAVEWWRQMEKTADFVKAKMNKFYC